MVKTRWRPHPSTNRTTTFLTSLGIEFHKAKGEDFWRINREILPELYERLQEEVKERMHELHPDKGGDEEQFKIFLAQYRRAQKNFLWAMPKRIGDPLPSTVTFTPIAQVRLAKRAAQARVWRKKNRKRFRAACKARYHKAKAAGKIDLVKHRESVRRYKKKHKRKVKTAIYRYRQAHPEKVREWRENYKKSTAARGIKRKKRSAERQRVIPGTPEYEHRKQRRLELYQKNKDKINARRRVPNKLPRQRDHKGHYLPRPLADAA